MSFKHCLSKIYQASVSPYTYLRARRIAHGYAHHHSGARKIYADAGRREQPIRPVGRVGVVELVPGRPNGFIVWTVEYENVIKRLSMAVQERLRFTKECLFFPKVE